MGCDVRRLVVHVPDQLVERRASSRAFVEVVTRGLVEGAAEPMTDDVDLLPRRAADIGHVEHVRLGSIESDGVWRRRRQPPVERCRSTKGLSAGTANGSPRRGLDPEDAEECVEPLARSALFRTPGSLSPRTRQIPVGAESEHPAGVVLVRLRGSSQHALVRRVGPICIERIPSELDDLQISIRALTRVEDRVEQAVLRVVRSMRWREGPTRPRRPPCLECRRTDPHGDAVSYVH